jgi:glycerophosphoryl diester phosphodiesterase
MEPLIRPPIGFAHRGASAHARENTLEAFRLALRLGATGLESDVWVTSDGVAVLDHDGIVRSGMWRRRIPDMSRDALPAHIPSLAEMYDACGTAFELSLDVKDPRAAQSAVSEARSAGGDAETRLWLCHHDWRQVASWRNFSDGIRLVDSTRARRVKEGAERRAAALADAGVDAINLHASDWTAGLVTLFHRFERFAFGWDAQFDRVLTKLLGMGVDAVYSDHVDRMVDAITAATR